MKIQKENRKQIAGNTYKTENKIKIAEQENQASSKHIGTIPEIKNIILTTTRHKRCIKQIANGYKVQPNRYTINPIYSKQILNKMKMATEG